jgi:hypothetical protein
VYFTKLRLYFLMKIVFRSKAMKKVIFNTFQLLLLAFLVSFNFCRSLKDQGDCLDKSFIVLLKNNYSIEYFTKNYSIDGFQKANKISKSENKWMIYFKVKKMDIVAIENKLLSDTNFVSVSSSDERLPKKPNNKTNSEQTKTQPINK